MGDFDQFVRSLADRDRVDIINALIAADAVAQRRARGRGSRAPLGSTERGRAQEARRQSERYGRIIYFLRFRSPATGSTEADLALCDLLAEKLAAKGQWLGEYSR